MSRSLRKGPFVDHHLLKKVRAMNLEEKKSPIKTWSRRSIITPEMIGHTFEVHNGKKFLTVFVSEALAREVFAVHIRKQWEILGLVPEGLLYTAPELKELAQALCIKNLRYSALWRKKTPMGELLKGKKPSSSLSISFNMETACMVRK